MAKKSIALITMSTRPVRVGPNVANWVHDAIKASPKAAENDQLLSIASVDLADFKLPIFDEIVPPARIKNPDEYKHEHSRRWAHEIKKHDGYLLVVPEYNYGVAGGTKNAIDFLLNEWAGKPAAIISYGLFGGTTAGSQVKASLKGMGLRVVDTTPALAFSGNVGPDAFAAMGDGSLGEDTKKLWQTEKTEEVLKAFEEVKVMLAEEKVSKGEEEKK